MNYLGQSPEPDESGTGAIEFGLQVHSAMAGDASAIAAAQREREKFEASPLGQRAARATRIEREFDVLFPVEDVVLRGQIDLWFEEGGELLLVDYKTDHDTSRASSYSLQLQLYAMALERYAGRLPNRAILYYVRSEQPVEVSLANLDEARQKVREMRNAQESLIFSLQPGSQCLKCPFYQGLCPQPKIE